jgi:hypothetical protein
MKKVIYRISKFATVSEIRRDRFRVVVHSCFDDSSMTFVSSRTKTQKIIRLMIMKPDSFKSTTCKRIRRFKKQHSWM